MSSGREKSLSVAGHRTPALTVRSRVAMTTKLIRVQRNMTEAHILFLNASKIQIMLYRVGIQDVSMKV